MPKQSIIVRPTVEQIKSGEVKTPETVYVSTLLAELPGGEEIFLRTLWKISHSDKRLVFLEGILDWDSLIEPLRGPPDSHLRAARRVAATVFGKARFRGEVNVSESNQLEEIFCVTTSDETCLLPTLEDVAIWTKLKQVEESKVDMISLVDFLQENSNLNKKEFLDQLMLRSTILRTRVKRLYSRKQIGDIASRNLSRVRKSDRVITEPYIVNRFNIISMRERIKSELRE